MRTQSPTPAWTPPPNDDLALRAVVTTAKRRVDARYAQRVFLQATEDLTLCSVAAWERLRNQGTTAEQLFALLQQTRFLLDEARERADILASRLARIDPRHRPYYSPDQRFRILEHMRRFMLSAQDAAARFYVTAQSIYNWIDDLREHPGVTTVGSTVKPTPPIRRFACAVRRLVLQMAHSGFGSEKKIAAHLARCHWKISPRTVRRICKEKRMPTPPDTPVDELDKRPTTVRGDHPNHLWLADITRIPTLFPFLSLHLLVILDACSRLPLASTLRFGEPSAATAIALFQTAFRGHGRPRHLVTDQGTQFTAETFRAFVKSHGIRHRFGAVGQTHSLGLIDRFFRTLKDSLSLRSIRPWLFRDFKLRLTTALIHYAYVRPHESLEGRTPIEVYYGIRGHLPQPVSPPRGRVGDPQPDIPFEILHLDPENRAFPLLLPKAA